MRFLPNLLWFNSDVTRYQAAWMPQPVKGCFRELLRLALLWRMKQSQALKLDKHGKDKRKKKECSLNSFELLLKQCKDWGEKGIRTPVLSAEPAWPGLLNILAHVRKRYTVKRHISSSLAVNSGPVAWHPFLDGHTGNWTPWSLRSLLLIFLTPLMKVFLSK